MTQFSPYFSMIWRASKILYPSLRVVDLLQVQRESVRSVPPRRVVPFGMKTLNLEVESHFSPNMAARADELRRSLTIDSL